MSQVASLSVHLVFGDVLAAVLYVSVLVDHSRTSSTSVGPLIKFIGAELELDYAIGVESSYQ